MPTLAAQYLLSFDRRARVRLGRLARQLAGALAGGDEDAAARLAHEGQLLSHGLESCQNLRNRLSEAERVYIAGKLLPLLRDAPLIISAMPTTLVFNPLPSRVRGNLNNGSLLLTFVVGGEVAPGSELLISRDGLLLRRLAVSAANTYTYLDATPGQLYRAELTGSGLVRERAWSLISGVRFGTLPRGATAAQLALLPLSFDSFADGIARFAFVGARTRMYLCVPKSQGRITQLTQPNDQNSDITPAFSRTSVTLDFGADGQDEYEVLENSADFIGPFAFDARIDPLVVPVLVAPAPAVPTSTTTTPSGAVIYPFTNQTLLTIDHNLGRYVVVEVYAANGELIGGDVTYLTSNTLRIQFSQPLTGTVVLL